MVPLPLPSITRFKNVNPDQKVPTIGVDDYNLPESMVILEFLNDLFPEKNLLPKDPLKRAQIRFAIEFFTVKVAPIWFTYVLQSQDPQARQVYIDNMNTGLRRLNDLLLEQAPTGPYFLGDQYSIADIAMAPFILRSQLYNRLYMNDLQFEAVQQLPRLAEFLKGMTQRPSVQATMISEEDFIEVLSHIGVKKPERGTH
ncbi:hypothetical protein EC973_002522 [Apophysomyces ossiformis]|uniref:Glutathione S-transferase n=1 Tax=Apophysomyces ossiformis TaxID=679940 RepID=A0A8H7BTL3_9FUNG|nr:hypothetical protein EC973_002522 [Apophysomyces ossiformis]